MAANRSEPFQQALAELRRRIARGEFAPEARLAAAALSSELGLSPTPVREALARLAGEGLLEDRRGQGFFLRRLSSRDVADLYGLAAAHLQIALAGRRASAPLDPAGPISDTQGPATAWAAVTSEAEAEPVAAADRLLARWVAEAGGVVLARSFRRVQLQLAPVRRAEPLHLQGLADEYVALRASPPWRRAPATRAFFRRRIRAARRLAEELEPPPEAA